ncbi:MAG: o-succinylbenzoate synthase [Muribaculaceae bacterium]|nr:o-succinylbenzoate synthase [Muribaculaceae bacterium]
MRLAICPYMLKFRQPAGTSRGVLTEKPTYLLKLWDERDPEVFGIGEAAVFPGLSPEADHRYEYKLIELLANIAIGRPTDLSRHSSIQFGLEQALRDFSSGGKGMYFPSEFTEGKSEITINGLIWMGSEEEMQQRLEEKIAAGFKCIKIKVGAIDWNKELGLVKYIRRRYSADEVTIRVDANGGFSMETVLPKLRQLEELGVHSIEQPIPAGNPDLMRFLCEVSPLPIALDEELIGVCGEEAKRYLLDYIHPAYIILKPALCGGFSGAEEWIKLAQERGIGWWVTSALESNVGLNAIAQFTGQLNPSLPQGLGTGGLFVNNFTSPLVLEGEHLRYSTENPLSYREQFKSLDWKD